MKPLKTLMIWIDQYRSDLGFTSADPLEKVDIGDGTIPRPTFLKRIYRLSIKLI